MTHPSHFKRTKIGWIIAGLTMCSAVNSTFFFLGMMKSGIAGWLMMNSCAPAIALFFFGFLFRSPALHGNPERLVCQASRSLAAAVQRNIRTSEVIRLEPAGVRT